MATRLPVGHLHHARIGVTAKTLANHKANLRAALRWFSDEHYVPQQGARLTADWAKLREQIDKPTRLRIFNFVRYCSARGITPSCVDDCILNEYWSYRTQFTAMVSHDSARRMMVRAWNSCTAALAGWSLQALTAPALKVTKPAWDEFPQGLRDDIDNYFAGLAKPRRSINGKRLKPCRPTTIANRRAEIIAVARTAVRRLGVPIQSLTCLAALLDPDLVDRFINYYWEKNGHEPKIGTIDLGWKFARMARDMNCLNEAALERLDEISAALEEYGREGMTEKNLKLVRQVLSGDVWSEVVSLPNVLMQEARAAKYHAPLKAAVSAQLATAIAILTFAPVRLGNLIRIELGQNLTKPGGLDTPYWLAFPNYDVKNRVNLNFKFDQPLTDLVDEYIREFRPTLLRGASASWLFPGEDGRPKHKLFFSKQITERIEKAVGLRITVHQFRHAAAAIYLKEDPGNYWEVQRILGHRSLTTTKKFYCALEAIAANELFGKVIRQRISFNPSSEEA